MSCSVGWCLQTLLSSAYVDDRTAIIIKKGRMSETYVLGTAEDQRHDYRGCVTACGHLRSSISSGVADNTLLDLAGHRR